MLVFLSVCAITQSNLQISAAPVGASLADFWSKTSKEAKADRTVGNEILSIHANKSTPDQLVKYIAAATGCEWKGSTLTRDDGVIANTRHSEAATRTLWLTNIATSFGQIATPTTPEEVAKKTWANVFGTLDIPTIAAIPSGSRLVLAINPNSLQQKLPDSAATKATEWLTTARNWSLAVPGRPVSPDENAFFDNPSEDPTSEYISIERPLHSPSLKCQLNYLNDRQQWISSVLVTLTPPSTAPTLNMPSNFSGRVKGTVDALRPHFVRERPHFLSADRRETLKSEPVRVEVSQSIEGVLQAIAEKNSLDLVLCLEDWKMGAATAYLASAPEKLYNHLSDLGLKAQVIDSCLVVGPDTTDCPVASINWNQLSTVVKDLGTHGYVPFDSLEKYSQSSDYSMQIDGLDTQLLRSIYPELSDAISTASANREVPSLRNAIAPGTPVTYDSLTPDIQNLIRKSVYRQNGFVKPGLGAPVFVEEIEPSFMPGANVLVSNTEHDDDGLMMFPNEDGPCSVTDLMSIAVRSWSKDGIHTDLSKQFKFRTCQRKLFRLTAEAPSHKSILLGELQEVISDQTPPVPFDQISSTVRNKIDSLYHSIHH